MRSENEAPKPIENREFQMNKRLNAQPHNRTTTHLNYRNDNNTITSSSIIMTTIGVLLVQPIASHCTLVDTSSALYLLACILGKKGTNKMAHACTTHPPGSSTLNSNRTRAPAPSSTGSTNDLPVGIRTASTTSLYGLRDNETTRQRDNETAPN